MDRRGNGHIYASEMRRPSGKRAGCSWAAATGDEAILRLYREITSAVPQYMSTAERPIRANNGTILPPGYINERVNMSDWEGPQNVGEVFYGSCWSEVSNMLHLADL